MKNLGNVKSAIQYCAMIALLHAIDAIKVIALNISKKTKYAKHVHLKNQSDFICLRI